MRCPSPGSASLILAGRPLLVCCCQIGLFLLASVSKRFPFLQTKGLSGLAGIAVIGQTSRVSSEQAIADGAQAGRP